MSGRSILDGFATYSPVYTAVLLGLTSALFVFCGRSNSSARPAPTLSPASRQLPEVVLPSLTTVEPGAPSAREILEASLAAMRGVRSFHFELDSDVESHYRGYDVKVPCTYVADYIAPDRVRGMLVAYVGYLAVESETLSVGDVTYTADAETGRWEIGNGAPSALPTLAELITGLSASTDGVVLLGQTEIDGTAVYLLEGVPGARLFDGSGLKPRVILWIGVADFLVRRMVAQGEVRLEDLRGLLGGVDMSGMGSMTMSIDFSDYGRPVAILAPRNPVAETKGEFLSNDSDIPFFQRFKEDPRRPIEVRPHGPIETLCWPYCDPGEIPVDRQ